MSLRCIQLALNPRKNFGAQVQGAHRLVKDHLDGGYFSQALRSVMLMRESCCQSLRAREAWADLQQRWASGVDVRVFISRQNDGVDTPGPQVGVP